MIAILVALSLAGGMEQSSHVAAARTDLALCAREAPITGRDAAHLCEQRRIVLASLASAPAPITVARDARGRIARSRAVVERFLREYPPPEWCLTHGRYDGTKCEVDHKRPRCAGGEDVIENLVYQPKAFAKISDVWEADLCRRLKACGIVR